MIKNKYAALAVVIFLAGMACGKMFADVDVPFLKTPSISREVRWSIGMYSGESPFRLSPRPGIANPILDPLYIKETNAWFCADPFLVKENGMWYVFFELLHTKTTIDKTQGDIAVAVSSDGVSWEYKGIVLDEKFHLSQPYVFSWDGNYYMIPETSRSKEVRLYKAVQFPYKWEFVKTLMKGIYNDAAIIYYNNKWWMFAETTPAAHDTLRLYYADTPLGEWHEHPKSPIIQGNPHIARPAGRFIILNDSVIRFAQDCKPLYGRRVNAFEITKLTEDDYIEQPRPENPILKESGSGWNTQGMHTIDAIQTDSENWVAFVDGQKKVTVLRWGKIRLEF